MRSKDEEWIRGTLKRKFEKIRTSENRKLKPKVENKQQKGRRRKKQKQRIIRNHQK